MLSSLRTLGLRNGLRVPNKIRALSSINRASTDNYFNDHRIEKTATSGNNKEFTYFLLGGARMIYASTARLGLMAFLGTLTPAADVMALASAEFDITAIPAGTTVTVKWRGKPIFVRHRTPEEIETEAAVDVSALRDQESDVSRVQDPNWLVVIGICTHLGCVPIANAGDYAGFFCPCHGSHYDNSGRIRKGPAPLNMELPPYKFLDNGTKLFLG